MANCTLAVGTADTNSSNATGVASGAFTPALGERLLVLALASGTVETAPTCSSSIGGFLFTFLPGSQVLWSGGGQSLYAFLSNAVVASATSQTVTVDCPSDASTGMVIFVIRIAGLTKGALLAVRQIAGNFGVSGTTPNVVFPGVCLTGNPVACIFGNGTNPAGITPPTSFTEPAGGDLGYATPTIGGEVCTRDSGHTSATVTWGSNSGNAWGALGVELDAALGGLLPKMMRYCG